MKYKSIFLLACAFMIIAFASCKKDLLKVNTNPTGVSPSDYNTNFTLSDVQMMYTGSTDYASEVWQTEWGNVAGYIQQTASVNTSFYSGDKYLFSPVNVGQYFYEAYNQQVEPVVDLLHLTANNPKLNNIHQMARIMRALVFQRLTDMYGDVPYFQAGLGYYDRIYTPVYDTQQAIYTDMLKEVSQAVDSLDVNGDIATGDLYYYTGTSTTAASQVAQWKKFGNSLLLRLAMRLTKVDPSLAQTWVTKVATSCMQSNADDAIVQHNLSANTASENRDAWVILTQDSTDLNLCSTFVNMLRTDKDPRLNVFSYIFRTDDTTAAGQNGLPPGFIVGNGKTTLFDITTNSTYNKALGMEGYSRPSPYVLNIGAPTMVMSYAQTELLLADASVRWGIGGDAETHYNNGITAGVTEAAALYGAPAPSAAQINYLINIGPTKYDPNNVPLNQINTQYWITCFMDEYEAWANWRRTSTGSPGTKDPSGYPMLTPTDYTGNITNGTIPRRLTYPSSEALSNGANLNAAIAREKGGKDVQTNRVWWDTQ